MTFATAFLVACSVFVVVVPIAMVAVLVVAAPGRPRLAVARSRELRVRAADPAQSSVVPGKVA